MKYVWIVEVMFEGHRKWESTVGAALSKSEAVKVLSDWQRRNPDDKFRLRKYVEAA